jgi:hypothetical protein
VSRVAVVCADLLLGSNLQGSLRAAGYEVTLVAEPAAAAGDVVVAVLDGREELLALGARRSIAIYSHVDSETKAAAEAAGFDLVVPRSRFMREGPLLIERLVRRPSP